MKLSISYGSSNQFDLPGTEPDSAGLAQIKASAPLKPSKPQEPCDVGLFSDTARQTDLCDLLNKTA